MGLWIKTYKHSYSMLHQIRQQALYCEGNKTDIFDFYNQEDAQTTFTQLINHCDCEGVYVSKSSKQYDRLKRKYCESGYFGDLDILKEECLRLSDYMKSKDCNAPDSVKSAFDKFAYDVLHTRKILKFD